MSALSDYVQAHTERGECQCGKCIDKGDNPDPPGHTADLIFFKVAACASPPPERKPPTRDEFIALSDAHDGIFGPCNPLDGAEHGYMELGGWIGDQGLAMRYMGLGTLLGVFQLLTPRTVIPAGLIPEELIMTMAERGMVAVKKVPVL